MKKSHPNTRERLLEAAGNLFAQNGFHQTTIAEICDAAEANIAAVNYHFGDKEALYDEVWRQAFSVAQLTYPLQNKTIEAPSMEDRLYMYAHAMLSRIFDPHDAGLFAQLLFREMANPTLSLGKIAAEAIQPQCEEVGDIVQQFMEIGLTDEQLHLCLHSIVGQCTFYNFSTSLRTLITGQKGFNAEEIGRMARHIARFSIGGLQAMKEEYA